MKLDKKPSKKRPKKETLFRTFFSLFCNRFTEHYDSKSGPNFRDIFFTLFLAKVNFQIRVRILIKNHHKFIKVDFTIVLLCGLNVFGD